MRTFTTPQSLRHLMSMHPHHFWACCAAQALCMRTRIPQRPGPSPQRLCRPGLPSQSCAEAGPAQLSTWGGVGAPGECLVRDEGWKLRRAVV